jgi:hypothetical protein
VGGGGGGGVGGGALASSVGVVGRWTEYGGAFEGYAGVVCSVGS